MKSIAQDCPKCHGKMEQGFIADFTHGGILVNMWVAGAPQKSFLLGTKAPRKKRIPIGTYRCARCGFLESYARTEFTAQ